MQALLDRDEVAGVCVDDLARSLTDCLILCLFVFKYEGAPGRLAPQPAPPAVSVPLLAPSPTTATLPSLAPQQPLSTSRPTQALVGTAPAPSLAMGSPTRRGGGR